MLIEYDGNNSSALAGFGQGTMPDIYLLQVKTGSGTLGNALYNLAQPNGTHQDVVDALKVIADTFPVYREVALKLAAAYAQEHGLTT